MTKDDKKQRRKRDSSSSKPKSAATGGGGGGDTEQNVKVAVRVRPFNKREEESNAKLIVEMEGNQTVLIDPSDGDRKKFAYDYSYWSHDGCKLGDDGAWVADPSHPNGGKYADQKRVFDDLGEGVLLNAWEGYNSTLFAYGQTGSGKSYSVVGMGDNKGIVPIFGERLFEQIEAKKEEPSDDPRVYEITFSMLEIYNEVVRDLLNPNPDKKGVKIREHPKKGFYVERLRVVPISSYKAIKEKIREGTKTRTIKATNMNETSSRAHTIVGITFTQKKKNAKGEEVSKSSITNLVDLAGSERVERTGATGDRLKEGAAINLSLTSLGKCISALADESQGKKVKVPFRDSVLTRLLMNALGGNSKTIMIAAISPASLDFEESLSTLRYADRAKEIKTKAIINEDPIEKLIRDLQEENQRLKAMIEGGDIPQGIPREDGQEGDQNDENENAEDFQARLEENERQIQMMSQSFEDKLEEAQAAATGQTQDQLNELKNNYPYLCNLNSDPLLNGMIVHIIRGKSTVIGNQKEDPLPDIVLLGASIADQHALIMSDDDFLENKLQCLGENSRVLINGKPVVGEVELHHNDRILFGTTQLYAFANPREARINDKDEEVKATWEDAQDEIARNSGFETAEVKSAEEARMHEELVEVLPAVEEANSISEALDKLTKFEMVVAPAESIGLVGDRSHIYIRVRNFTNGLIYDWQKEKFLCRFIQMQQMYAHFADGEDWKVPEEEDPFTEPIDMPVRIGVVSIFLKSIAYMIPARGQFEVTDIRGNEVGLLNLEVVICDEKGEEFNEQSDVWVDNPSSLIGQDMHFVVKINFARGLPPRFTDVQAKYRVFLDQDHTSTQIISDDSNPNFEHSKMFSFKPVTQDVLKYLLDGKILVELWGVQMPMQRQVVGNTQVLMQMEALSKGSDINAGAPTGKLIDSEKHKLQMEVDALRKREEKVTEKLGYLRELLKQAETKGTKSLPTNQVKGILDAPTSDAIKRWALMNLDEETLAQNNVANGTAPKRPPSAKSSSSCNLM